MEATALAEIPPIPPAAAEEKSGPPPLPKLPPALKKVVERQPPWVQRAGRATLRFFRRVFGMAALIFGLAVLASIPILNFLTLGYMLEVSGRIARSGKFRAGFVGNRKASVLGAAAIIGWLTLLPVRFVSGLWKDAQLIDPTSTSTWLTWTLLITMSLIGLLIAFAAFVILAWTVLGHGNRDGLFVFVRDCVLDYIQSLRLPYYFWLGARGFAGGLLWLFLPVSILILAANVPAPGGSAALAFLGAVLLMPVVLWLPFVGTNFARTGEFKAFFQLGEVRRLYRRAPVAFWLSLFVTLLFAQPLYLLKIELTPAELAWLPAIAFVIFILPARMVAGWAMGRAIRHEEPRHGFWRWSGRLAAFPVVFGYVLWIWAMQFTQWSGEVSMLDQHAFLLPAPLMSW